MTANQSFSYQVKFPMLNKGKRGVRTIGITSDPARYFQPGTPTRFLRDDGKLFKLTDAGLVEA